MSRLEEIKRRHAAAMVGPWSLQDDGTNGRMIADIKGSFVLRGTDHGEPDLNAYDEDLEFVAKSWEDVRWLIEEVERLRRDQESIGHVLVCAAKANGGKVEIPQEYLIVNGNKQVESIRYDDPSTGNVVFKFRLKDEAPE